MTVSPLLDAERRWEAEQRTTVVSYLDDEGIARAEVGGEPAWAVYPYISLWAVESLKSPGWVGWWAISGDLPTDYCSADGIRDPRSAVRRIAERWNASLEQQPSDIRPLLASRVRLLLQWVEDRDIWPAS